MPRFGVAAGADPAPPRHRRALRLRLSHPARRRPEVARRAQRARARTSPTCTRGPRPTCPGAGWIGLDATSGLLAGEGHIPLACAALPTSAAPVTGMTEVAQEHARLRDDGHAHPRGSARHASPSPTRSGAPSTRSAARSTASSPTTTCASPWAASPRSSPSTTWRAPSGTTPRCRSTSSSSRRSCCYRLRERFAPGGLLHFGQGKWYPGEPLPRWALSCFWRKDGVPLWEAPEAEPHERAGHVHRARTPQRFATELAQALGLSPDYVMPAYDDPWRILRDEANLPAERRRALRGHADRGRAPPPGRPHRRGHRQAAWATCCR